MLPHLPTSVINFGSNSGVNPAKPSSVQSSYNQKWMDRYMKKSYFLNDPVTHIGMQPITRTICQIIPEQFRQSELYEEAKCFDADANAVVTSLYGGNKMILAAKLDATSTQEMNDLKTSTIKMHRIEIASRVDLLTDRQLEVMELAEEGNSQKAIAAEMGISIPGVAQHKIAICKTLDILNWTCALNAYSLQKWGNLSA